MVNGIYIALSQSTDNFTILVTFTHSHTHSYTDGRGCHARCQMHMRRNLEFSILLKDTLTCSSAQPGGAGIQTPFKPTIEIITLSCTGCGAISQEILLIGPDVSPHSMTTLTQTRPGYNRLFSRHFGLSKQEQHRSNQ